MSDKFDTTMQMHDKGISEIEAMPIADYAKENLKREYCGFRPLTPIEYHLMQQKMIADSNSLTDSNLF